MGPVGPQGPQEGTGSPPEGSPGQGEHGEVVPDVFGKSHCFDLKKRTRVSELDFENLALRCPICLPSCTWGGGSDVLDWDQTNEKNRVTKDR